MPGPDARGGGWDVRAICAITVRTVSAVAPHGVYRAVMGWPTPSETIGRCDKAKCLNFYLVVRNSLLIFGEPKQTNMKREPFSSGDYIFYRDGAGATQPHIVLEARHRGVSRGGWYVRLDDGRWVKASNCQLQEEWRKENEA